MALFPGSRLHHQRKPLTLALLLLFGGLGVSLPACSRVPGSSSPVGQLAGGQPQVVAADGVLCDLTQRLAAGELAVGCLLQPADDPHDFRLRPDQKAQITGARLLLISGYDLTPALESLSGAVAISEKAVPQPLRLTPEGSGQPVGEHNHEAEHDHGDFDPHVWHNPRQAAAMAAVIADQLSRLDPPAAEGIQRRSRAMAEQLDHLDAWNRKQFNALPKPWPPLASSHRAFASLALAYGLDELPLVDATSTSEALRPDAFRQVVDNLRAGSTPRLFAEQSPPARTLQRISELSGVPIAAVPLAADGLAMGPEGPLSLMATLVRNTCTIVEGWGGRCDRQGGEALTQAWSRIN
ncbi:metal ABC transporter substrate-binding protein [Synechococcus sp. RedBA-s]|uniref:metal ABC transporter substrate-binding protein n=1 Tax=Synechococcus sp. RedBA-s TaxID=2823741 RepID=UPI0020CE357E|nr:metal ABC transporter substrate-binding protein [Synechococcus sp. RedBA-s]MCP9800045.1 zinc ABC transporter substrate-binding protein [Synechococcus sp. RedBA-s]